MNGSSGGNKMTRSSDGCDDDALANISPLDILTALRLKYGLINDVKEATIITPTAASPASGKADILPPPTISKSSSSSIKSFHYAAALSASKSLFDDGSFVASNSSSSANYFIDERIQQNTTCLLHHA
jgi:hypothetical protein